MTKKLSYHKSVNYDIADPAKVLAQKEGLATAQNMPHGFSEVEGTRGESAYVFRMGSMYGALVQEGLGTKSLIAQTIYKDSGKSYFANIAKDTVATFVNDLVSVGATPVVTNAYWSSSSYDWLADKKLTTDFIKGWRTACDEAGIVWGGGETQSLPGIVNEDVLELAGSAFGVINDEKRLMRSSNLQTKDAILLIESNGVHANGISLVREIAKSLKDGYRTKLPDGSSFGEAALAPTHLYAKLVDALFAAGLNIHYLSNITGHGWRKLMRAEAEFSYVMEQVPDPQPIFGFIAEHSGNDQKEMYGNYNMGAGYAVYLTPGDAAKAQKIAKKLGFKSWIAGTVEKGPKRVVIKPKNITFEGSSLGVR
jgi:phosphoribosylformylglycinamidine cyclo-ligase